MTTTEWVAIAAASSSSSFKQCPVIEYAMVCNGQIMYQPVDVLKSATMLHVKFSILQIFYLEHIAI